MASADEARSSVLVELAGTVEVSDPTVLKWVPATTNALLRTGTLLRTGPGSRATIQLSTRSVLRVDQSSLVQIQEPSNPGMRRKFWLKLGRIFFLDREKPGDIEFETPLSTGAIRGTEFVLSVTAGDDTTILSMLDGRVSLASSGENVDAVSGEEVTLQKGKAATKVRGIMVSARVQWCLYYPAIVDPSDIAFTSEEREKLSPSLDAYNQGDLVRAHELADSLSSANSVSVRTYLAALALALGNSAETIRFLDSIPPDSPAIRALREVIATVQLHPLKETVVPTTASEWLARSYSLQAQSKLSEAHEAAELAASLSAKFGYAWTRKAELEVSLGRIRIAAKTLSTAVAVSPLNPGNQVILGYLELERGHPNAALTAFSLALLRDGGNGSAWLGRALSLEQTGRVDEARSAMQVAAAMEPQRSLFRSYLGRSFHSSGDYSRAGTELQLASKMDPADPTPALYSALLNESINRLNQSIRDLEESIRLNDNRSVFRSKLLLDKDRSSRSADLASIYNRAGLEEVSIQSSSRAIADDYANFSGHLFRANSLALREDPSHFNLRYETPRQSELLLANLLAPSGAGNLSQLASQQDRLRPWEARPVGLSSFSQYESLGNWLQEGSLYGQVEGLSYSLDGSYASRRGVAPNTDSLREQAFIHAKQRITDQDSLYVQAGWMSAESGDVAQYYDPASVKSGLRVKEAQEPQLYLGWHHEWSPGSHTLLLLSRLEDSLALSDPDHPLIFLNQTAGVITDVDFNRARFDLKSRSDFTLYSAELQQVLESPHHSLVAGGRIQEGEVSMSSLLATPLPPSLADQTVSPALQRLSLYSYYTWRPVDELRITGGLTLDDLHHPSNVDLPPVLDTQAEEFRLAPKLGIAWSPLEKTHFHAAWTRSLGGLYFDDSIRLEPSQVAGFDQAFRSLIPESVEGIIPGTKFETFGIGMDQSLGKGTYLGADAELLRSAGWRSVGAVSNSLPLPLADTPVQTLQMLDYEERSLAVHASQLLGDSWSVGARYRFSQSELTGSFPQIPPNANGLAALSQNESAILHQVRGSVFFNHRSGVFAQWHSQWFQQSNTGYAIDLPGDDFWQHSLISGYRFAGHRAELRFGLLNIADTDYRLNPLNLHADLPRARTFVVSLRLNL